MRALFIFHTFWRFDYEEKRPLWLGPFTIDKRSRAGPGRTLPSARELGPL